MNKRELSHKTLKCMLQINHALQQHHGLEM